MEIEKKTTKKIHFEDLKVGDVFLDEDDAVMMVVDEDFGLGNDGGNGYDGYAIDLTTGYHYGYDAEDEVTKVSAKLTITD